MPSLVKFLAEFIAVDGLLEELLAYFRIPFAYLDIHRTLNPFFFFDG